ncbi:MAG TPA: crossover junction endodeoxyribonuclease RuvC [Planctomycetota bacterium]|jgi:crossover junction endodeoxyribonuclease RuvC|nr:crossover junction endodeoxyribonuclease RuvC [Planctomycetota bacterium]
MKILAIDPGTQRTGYAVLEVNGRKPSLSECGCVFVRGKDLPERLLHIHKGIERLFRRHRPSHVVIERPFVGKSARDAMTLNAGRAVCMLAAAAARARVFDYAPAQVKKAATGNGQATKDFVQRMVAATLGLKETPPADAADAIALGLCHVNRL